MGHPRLLCYKPSRASDAFTFELASCFSRKYNGLLCFHLHPVPGGRTHLSDGQLSGKRNGQHQTVKLILVLSHSIRHLQVMIHQQCSHSSRIQISPTHTCSAKLGSQKSCRTPKQTGQTSESVCAGVTGSSSTLMRLFSGAAVFSSPEASWD